MAEREENVAMRRFVPPFGWPIKFRVLVVTPSKRHPLIVANRYTRQIIGFAVRLPDRKGLTYGQHRALSIMWAKPARWWLR